LPVFLVEIGTFLTAIWGINGVIWLRSQQRPSRTRLTFDYSYGLALDEITPSHDTENEGNTLEFSFRIRNVAPGAIRYNVERMDVIIGDRIRTLRNCTGTLPRNSWILLHVSDFQRNIVDDLPDRTEGTYSIQSFMAIPKMGIRAVRESAFTFI
jgi:hypothetical protein